jgi:hypothetical protein
VNLPEQPALSILACGSRRRPPRSAPRAPALDLVLGARAEREHDAVAQLLARLELAQHLLARARAQAREQLRDGRARRAEQVERLRVRGREREVQRERRGARVLQLRGVSGGRAPWPVARTGFASASCRADQPRARRRQKTRTTQVTSTSRAPNSRPATTTGGRTCQPAGSSSGPSSCPDAASYAASRSGGNGPGAVRGVYVIGAASLQYRRVSARSAAKKGRTLTCSESRARPGARSPRAGTRRSPARLSPQS